MDRSLLCLVVLIVAVMFYQPGESCGRSNGNGNDRPPVNQGVNLTVDNQFKSPNFRHTTEVNYTGNVLLRYLEQACVQDNPNFHNFTATFHHLYGYFIDAINGVFGTYDVDQSYWYISNNNGALQKGVSSYVPVPGDNITFTLCNSQSCP